MKQLKQPIFYLQWFLILFSAIAFGLAFFEGCKMSFDISSKGFQTYLHLYEPYAILFAATFVVITAQLAIERLGLMSDANNTSYKTSTRTVWIQIMRDFLADVRITDSYMVKQINSDLILIHDYLFDKNYKFSSEKELKEFFDKFFSNKVEWFEQMNHEYIDIGYYHSEKHSYSWDAFRYLVMVMVNSEECYKKWFIDLQKFYTETVLEMPDRLIDREMYWSIRNEINRTKKKKD